MRCFSPVFFSFSFTQDWADKWKPMLQSILAAADPRLTPRKRSGNPKKKGGCSMIPDLFHGSLENVSREEQRSIFLDFRECVEIDPW